MTKLEKLTALLVNELNDFNNSVERLEKISEKINTTKIKMDVAEYKSIIEDHKKQMTMHKEMIEGFERRFNEKIEKAKIYPNWAVVIFIVCIVVTAVLVSYMFFK